MSTLSDLEMTELAEACWKDGARGWRAEVESIIARHVTAALAAKADEIEDEHCATCQCRGTACRNSPFCKRVWGHSGACSVIREEAFR